MKRQALSWIVAAGLLCAGRVAADPLEDLRARLTGLRSSEPIRLEVDVEMEHRGTAPLHLNDAKLRGTAIVRLGRRGITVRERSRRGDITQFSLWQEPREGPIPLIDDDTARQLTDPAEMIEELLRDGVLVSDEAVTWQERPARLLVIRPEVPEELANARGSAKGDRPPFVGDAKIWLDENGTPLAMESSAELRLGTKIRMTMTSDQAVTFQQAGGRLLVAELRQTYSGTGPVMRGRDEKRLKVSVMR